MRENELNFIRLLEQSPVEQLVWRVLNRASAASNTSSGAKFKRKVPPTQDLKDMIYNFINAKPGSEERLRWDLESYYKVNPNDIAEIFHDIELGLRSIDR